MSVTRRENKELVRRQFTKTAEVFGEFAVASRGVEAAKLARMIQAERSERLIDVACGPGTLSLRFAPLVGWACGVDLTPAILERAKASARRGGVQNLEFLVADAQRLPFAAGSLDIAISSYALHHMPDAAEVIAEMARTVRAGGRVGVIDIRAEEDPAVGERNNLIERIRDSSHTRTLRQSEFEQIFRAHRLRLVGLEIQENARRFDHWLHVAGWHRDDGAYQEARRLMEATLENDAAGFHPRFEATGPGQAPELVITNTALILAGEKF